MAPTRRLHRLPVLLLATTVAAAPAAAQGWFGNLFGGGSPVPRQGAPAYPGYGAPAARGGGYGYTAPDDYERPRPRRRVQRRVAPPEDTVREAKAPPKNASLFVDVFGDSLAQTLADGLDDALADRADVAVMHKVKPASGLVGTDGTDWPKAVDDLLAGREGASEEKNADPARAAADKANADKKVDNAKDADKPKPPRIDVAVIMIGTNDRQAIRRDGKTLPFGSPEWEAAYTKRVTAIDDAFRAHGIPLVWVGLPIARDDGFADAMASLNDITREAAAKSGATYVDTWDAFSDDNGDFSSFGPDVNGQTVRLRSSDGVHFTRAGARKLAHFVETHVRRALDGKTPSAALPADAKEDGKPVAVAKPDAGPVHNLADLPESDKGTLAALPPPASGDAGRTDTLAATTLVRGEAVPIPPGRADDAKWPKQGLPDP